MSIYKMVSLPFFTGISSAAQNKASLRKRRRPRSSEVWGDVHREPLSRLQGGSLRERTAAPSGRELSPKVTEGASGSLNRTVGSCAHSRTIRCSHVFLSSRRKEPKAARGKINWIFPRTPSVPYLRGRRLHMGRLRCDGLPDFETGGGNPPQSRRTPSMEVLVQPLELSVATNLSAAFPVSRRFLPSAVTPARRSQGWPAQEKGRRPRRTPSMEALVQPLKSCCTISLFSGTLQTEIGNDLTF